MRVQALAAAIWLMASWVIFLLADLTLLSGLSILAVMVAAVGLVAYFRRDGWISPINTAILFSSITTTITLIWMLAYLNDRLDFFHYMFLVDPQQLIWLAQEQLIFMTCVFAAYLMMHLMKIRGAKIIRPRDFIPPKWMWRSAYLIGMFALFSLFLLSGDLSHIFSSLSSIASRQAHRGWLVFLVYFAFAGALLWFRRNVHLSPMRRYSGLVLLLIPLLLTGSRGGLFAIFIAAACVDEQLGARVRLHMIVTVTFVIAVFFVLYAMFRAGDSGTFFNTLFLDISMQIGYVIAIKNHMLNTGFHPEALLAAVKPFIPSSLGLFSSFLSPARYFTDTLFPLATGFTASMGLYGEAHYIFPGLATIPYYLFIGIVLTIVQVRGRRLPVVFYGIFAGGAYRIIRGGFLPGIAFAIELLFPIIFLWVVSLLIANASGKRSLGYMSVGDR